MMNRLDVLKILARHVTDEIVVATYSSATDWLAINDRPLNYFSFGAMGLASSHGLGLALARPERRVVVLDGDGSLLMNLGTLVTIAAVAPKNFTHLLFRNGSYEANGGHPLPNPDTDFAGLARSAGIASCATIADLSEFEERVRALLTDDGPLFACLEVEQGPLTRRDYAEMYSAERRRAFRAALDAGA
jgi:thiamine pyrophosphate-dependent acetolactate synthase large subunit-like protein